MMPVFRVRAFRQLQRLRASDWSTGGSRSKQPMTRRAGRSCYSLTAAACAAKLAAPPRRSLLSFAAASSCARQSVKNTITQGDEWLGFRV